VRLDRLALGPAERALDAALAGPLPEALGRSLAEHRVVERVVAEMLETAAPAGTNGDRYEQLADRIANGDAGRLVEAYVERLTASEAFRRALTEILSGPEVRQALTRQTGGFADEVAHAGRRRARAIDDAIEAKARRGVRLSDLDPVHRYGGLASRGTGLVIDAALAQLAFLVISGTVALIAGLAGGLHGGWLPGTLVGAGWLIVSAAYFVVFWSTGGQTPGMRVMRVRVVTASGQPLSVLRSLVRFAGLLLAIIPVFLGFLPVPFDGRRRALPDFLAGTIVYCTPDEP
jgi:uncharacterized RDD family membrane protein YckC